MGIKRCPYCRALISDEDQYCKNCGTQLLFPEDEEIEEEIPGDKIIEDDRQRDTTEEPDEEMDEDEKMTEESEEKQKIEEEARGQEEEVILVEEETREQEIEKETSETRSFERRPDKTSSPRERLSTHKGERLLFPEEEGGQSESRVPVSQKTRGEDLIKKLEKEILVEQETETEPAEEKRPGPVTQMVEELGIEEKSRIKKEQIEDRAAGFEKSQKEDMGELPSWIKEVRKAEMDTGSTELIKKAEITPESKESEIPETGTDEEWLEEEEPASESTMGFPEKVTRSHLELEKEEFAGEEEMEEEEEAGEEETAEGYVYEERPGAFVQGEREISQRSLQEEKLLPSLGFKNFIKAKIFDLLFIVLFWLVSIWMAARSMEVTVFKLLNVATSGLLIFLLILTSVYFFLFYFFIGETLGDRLFRESEEEEHF